MLVKFYGKKSILDALKNEYKIINLYCLNKDNIPKEIDSKKVIIKNKKFFDEFININHQNIIGEFEIDIKFWDLNEAIDNLKGLNKQIIVVLDEIQDPRNFGAILRNCLAYDVDLVIYKTNNQVQLNDLAIKTSLGAIHQLKLVKIANINQAINKLKENGYWIYASCLNKDSTFLSDISFDNKTVIIIGNEDYGISELTIKVSDFKVSIKTSNKIQSLNASVASGILLNKIFNDIK